MGGHHILRRRSGEVISDTWAVNVMSGYHLKRGLSWAVIIEPVHGHGQSSFIPWVLMGGHHVPRGRSWAVIIDCVAGNGRFSFIVWSIMGGHK